MNSSNKNTKENFSLPALQNGDRAEFARVVNAYSDQIYRLALKMLRDPQDAEDILQETFINAYHGFSGFKGNSKISTWLYRIAANEALMLIRRRKENEISLQKTVESDEGDSFEPLNLTDWCCLPESELLSTEAIDYLNRKIEIISKNLRNVFLMQHIECLSTAETDDVL